MLTVPVPAIAGMEGYMLGQGMQAYQQAAAMHAAASQDAFAATMSQAQATQSAQLMQQAVLAGFPLSHAQATQMAQQAQQANFMAHQALAQQQVAAAGAYFAQVRAVGGLTSLS